MKFLNLFSLISIIFLNFFILIEKPKEQYDFTPEPVSIPEEYELNVEVTSYSPSENANYMTTYFSNLNDNMAYNFDSSCVFVALSSVLSYYDSWYNDDFIPEYFDANSEATSINTALTTSPGIKTVSSEFSTTDGTISDALDSIITNNYNDFSCYLMWHSYNNLNTDSNVIGNLSTKKIQTLLDYIYGDNYINLISIGLTENYTEDTSITQTEKINFIKNCIDNGKPCIVSISGYSTSNSSSHSRHAVVAYAYDNEHIYANFGWRDTNDTQYHPMLNVSTHRLIYDTINYAVAFNINSSFKPHSNNYVIYNSGVYNFYSYNGLLNDEEAMHLHPINHPVNSTTHSYPCPTCNFVVKIPHTNTTFTTIGNINHIKNCSSSSCSSITESHKYTYERKTSYHKEICVECGYTQNIAHTYGTYTFKNIETEVADDYITQVRCIYCGQIQS